MEAGVLSPFAVLLRTFEIFSVASKRLGISLQCTFFVPSRLMFCCGSKRLLQLSWCFASSMLDSKVWVLVDEK